jgi:hypothetical protein
VPRLVRAQGPDGRVRWSLVAANGRPLATSVQWYRSDDDLVSAVGELLAERAVLRYALGQEGGRMWVWTAHLPVRTTRPGAGEGDPIARSARGYLRRDQCRQSMDGFRAGVEQVRQRLRATGGIDRLAW